MKVIIIKLYIKTMGPACEIVLTLTCYIAHRLFLSALCLLLWGLIKLFTPALY